MEKHVGRLSKPIQATSAAIRIKILSMGEPNVGKSCLIKRYCEGRFIADYISTIGIDYGVKTIAIDQTEVKVNFWDVAGDPVYFEVRNEFYKDTHGAILVYDVNTKSSFEAVERWIDELSTFYTNEVTIFLVANKTDLNTRLVSSTEGKLLADKLNIRYFETSAATGEGVQDVFDALFLTVVNTINTKK